MRAYRGAWSCGCVEHNKPTGNVRGVTVANRKLRKITKRQRKAAREACAELREVAAAAGCPLPSLGVVPGASLITGEVLVDLGWARPESVANLVDVLRVGLESLAAKSSPVTPLLRPRVGDLVVDTESERVGEFEGSTDTGWTLSPWPSPGETWTADPLKVRVPTSNERARAVMATESADSTQKVG
ncbi:MULTISPECIES: hypothetical protein [unclassified Kitasatospora]|uniref:hypothetical protein n=1 Tax=unclassified Kitasatospora TaxID=2633591 RepID=UPI0033E665D8